MLHVGVEGVGIGRSLGLIGDPGSAGSSLKQSGKTKTIPYVLRTQPPYLTPPLCLDGCIIMAEPQGPAFSICVPYHINGCELVPDTLLSSLSLHQCRYSSPGLLFHQLGHTSGS